VKKAGATVDLSPFSRANVARFTLSSDGSLAPVAD
jgi:cytoskeleton protein RodZ